MSVDAQPSNMLMSLKQKFASYCTINWISSPTVGNDIDDKEFRRFRLRIAKKITDVKFDKRTVSITNITDGYIDCESEQ